MIDGIWPVIEAGLPILAMADSAFKSKCYNKAITYYLASLRLYENLIRVQDDAYYHYVLHTILCNIYFNLFYCHSNFVLTKSNVLKCTHYLLQTKEQMFLLNYTNTKVVDKILKRLLEVDESYNTIV
jgi:hypothetical protein